MSIICPNCGFEDSTVIDTRTTITDKICRQRRCLKCKTTFATYEMIRKDMPLANEEVFIKMRNGKTVLYQSIVIKEYLISRFYTTNDQTQRILTNIARGVRDYVYFGKRLRKNITEAAFEIFVVRGLYEEDFRLFVQFLLTEKKISNMQELTEVIDKYKELIQLSAEEIIKKYKVHYSRHSNK